MCPSCRLGLLITLLVLCAGCDVYGPSLLVDGPVGETPTTEGSGVGWWSGADPGTNCYSARIPSQADRPATSDPGDNIELVFALRSMRLGALNEQGELDELAWLNLGFDLDGTCTRSPTCTVVEPIVSCKPNSFTISSDGNFCRDNMFGRMEYAIAANKDIGGRFGLNDSMFNCSICQGAFNFLFRLSDYNGQPNDNSVRVDIYPSPGIPDLKPIDCTKPSWDTAQCWVQTDPWRVQKAYVNATTGTHSVGSSRLYDPAAFVREGYVVATLPANTEFWFPGNRAVATAFPVVLQGGMVTGKIEKNDQGEWAIRDGIISGRMTVTDAIESFQKIGMCPGDPVEATVKSFATQWADVLSNGAILPDTPCDALSAGIAFTADRATIGEVAVVQELRPCVADAGVDGGGG